MLSPYRQPRPLLCADIMRVVSTIAGAERTRAWDTVAHLDIVGVTADSRRVVPGDLFAALPGSQADGRTFIADAVERGAIAILAPQGTPWPPGVPPRPIIMDPEPRQCLARIAVVLAGPQPETMVAITGTNGKTSTAEFIRQLWASTGRKAASLGTLGLIAPGFDPGTRADDAGSGQPGGNARGFGTAWDNQRGDRGLIARPRSVPSRWCPTRCCSIHQPDAGPPGLSRHARCLPTG